MRRGIRSRMEGSAPSSSSINARDPVAGRVTEEQVAIPRIEPIVLAARAGAPQAPAVRIFMGTEPAQHRAERIFVYALAQVRNPDRRYEIYRMTSLPGFVQAGWRTGFTNYRFAIPDLAGRHGRALYNDVDQLYTADPATLFDQPMGEHGYLALAPRETAVMLIDCERMHPLLEHGRPPPRKAKKSCTRWRPRYRAAWESWMPSGTPGIWNINMANPGCYITQRCICSPGDRCPPNTATRSIPTPNFSQP